MMRNVPLLDLDSDRTVNGRETRLQRLNASECPALAVCHYSKEHLRRRCLKELGRSPMDHLAFMRVQRARELLEHTNDKLSVIAPLVGYSDAAPLSRAFRRYTGHSPGDYRRRR